MFDDLYIYLNKLAKLSFQEEKTEKRFQREYQKNTLWQNKFAMYATLISYLLYLPFSYFITPNEFYIDLILMLSLPITTTIIFISRVDKDCFKNNVPLALFVYSILIAIPPIISLFYTTEYYQIYLNNYLLLIIGISIMFGAPFVITFFALLIVNTGMIIILFMSNVETSFIYYNLYYIGTAFTVTSISSYFIESNRRKSYKSLFKQEDLNIKIKKQDILIKQQAKHAQMGEMISMIAHQWRQPLGAINSTLMGIKIKKETGKYDLENKEDRDDFCEFIDKKHENIAKYTKFLSDTIDDFRNFFKPDKEKESVSIISPIDKALNLLEGSMSNKNIKLIKNFKTDDKILIFPNELMQVILNILRNAEDNFLEKDIKDRVIRISTEKELLTPKKNINEKCIHETDSFYTIKIYDNGGGIPIDIIKDIFNPYFSTKNEKNGTGLGLYMSKTIIEEHHCGKLTAENIENGVCFTITLKLEL